MENAESDQKDVSENLRIELRIRQLDAELAVKKAELANNLTTYGLKGTLTGTIGGIIMVIALAILGHFSPLLKITGNHLTIIIGLICVTVALYGAFVFNRSASIAARIGDQAFRATAEKSEAGLSQG